MSSQEVRRTFAAVVLELLDLILSLSVIGSFPAVKHLSHIGNTVRRFIHNSTFSMPTVCAQELFIAGSCGIRFWRSIWNNLLEPAMSLSKAFSEWLVHRKNSPHTLGKQIPFYLLIYGMTRYNKKTGPFQWSYYKTAIPHKCRQGLIYSFGEEGMQLVQPSKFFSVTIFRTRFYRQHWHARVRTWAMLLFLVTLKNFDVCTVTMGVACPLLRRSI